MDLVTLKESALEALDEYVRARGGRCTAERHLVLEALLGLDRHFQMEQLIESCRTKDLNISRATLFNNVKEMVQAGILTKFYFHDAPYYEFTYLQEKHHHMICDRCGKVMEFQNPEMDKLISSSRYKRFQMFSSTVYVTGICSSCATQIKKQSKKLKLYLK